MTRPANVKPFTLDDLRRKARFGHRAYVYWRTGGGDLEWAPYGADAIKRAILAVGIRGRFYWMDGGGVSYVARSFGMMTLLWRNAKRGDF